MPTDDYAREQAVCSMFERGFDPERIGRALRLGQDEVLEILIRNGVIEPGPDEDRSALMARARRPR